MGHVFICRTCCWLKAKKSKTKQNYSLPLLKSSEKSLRLAEGNCDCSSLKLPLIIDSPVNNKKKTTAVFPLLLEVEINPEFFFWGGFFFALPFRREPSQVAMVTIRNNTQRIFFFLLNVNLLHTQAIIHCGSKPGLRCVFSLFSIIESPQKEPMENCIPFSLEGNFVRP